MTPARYSTLSISLHWLMLLLLAAVYACIELRVLFERGSEPRELLKTWHFMLGLAVFALVWVRLIARWFGGTPVIAPPIPKWQHALARIVHLGLYLLMIGMPLGGWLILSLQGKPVPFFGLTLPPLAAQDKELARLIKEIHETIGVAGYWLIGLHAVAALFHHYFQKDDTLRRMLPIAR